MCKTTTVALNICYQCGRLRQLIWNSRCDVCVVAALEFNLKENEALHAENAGLQDLLSQYKHAAAETNVQLKKLVE